ncbi:Valyl-tRNA synthetase [Operophtera brumata]|uniref:valine--tRNA ligase n=1 Tax=Operophtera brumata TaxID=104452 RepID=A0A0L7L9M1_OPEBR|nr:Valyl-tRNA synthetase [Operophtera brumata]
MIAFHQNYLALQLRLHKRFISSTTRTILKDELPSPAYKPEVVERNNYEKWEEEGRFKAKVSTEKPTFSMVLPPPNVTGKLHLVNTAFIRLFEKGLIYRKKALVNWCNALKSTVSDIEVENVAIKGPTELTVAGYEGPVKFGQIYEFSYKVCDSGEEIVVATTMPETMLGAVKITPGHSKVDYDIAKQHHLPLVQVLDEEGCMVNSGNFNKLKRYDCRKILVEKLDEMGLLKKISPHEMSLPICSRSGDVINHIPKEQWFLSCTDLNEKAAELVRNGKLKILPEKFVNYWLNWTGDDRDWCISRQLWWGHQIPAYKCSVGKEFIWIAATDETEAKFEASKFLRTLPEEIIVERDSDVLDTWFSSGIYPFSSLGWPDNTRDLNNYYPLSLMATGHDILGFWVHRMVILGLQLTERLPFENVLLHGIICDNKGAKMSKSKGNVIDPIDVIDGISMQGLQEKSQDLFRTGILTKNELDRALAYHKSNFFNTNGIPDCGVDALRFTLLSQDIKSHFVNFDVAMCHSNKLFCNKIWQSVKYMQLSYSKLKSTNDEITHDDLTYFDKWILSRLAKMVEKVNTSMDEYDFHLATKAIRTLIYNEFCDVYLEATKPGFDSENFKIGYSHAHTLSVVLNTALRCLAPYMIYITEEVIPKIPSFETNIIHNFNDNHIMYFDFPKIKDFKIWKDDETEKRVEKVLSSVNLVRELKGLYNISNKLRPNIVICSKDNDFVTDVKDNKNIVLNLMRCSDLLFETDDRKYVTCLLDNNTEISVEMMGNDAENAILAARSKLQKKIRKLEDSLSKMEAKLSSNKYLENAPEWIQLIEIEKMITKRKELEQLQRLI